MSRRYRGTSAQSAQNDETYGKSCPSACYLRPEPVSETTAVISSDPVNISVTCSRVSTLHEVRKLSVKMCVIFPVILDGKFASKT